MAPDVSLITVAGDYIGTLDAMLSHYRAAGIEPLTVHANTHGRDDPILAEILRIASEHGANVSCQLSKRWSPPDNTFLYTIPRSEHPQQWFIVADQDEFHDYPDDIRAIVEYCERKGYDFVEGCLVDRLPEDGILREIIPRASVWEQCPLGSMLSARVLRAVTNKIVLTKGHVALGHGQHNAYSGRGCPPDEIYVPVHHFKWVPSALERLQTRSMSLSRGLYTNECRRFLDYYNQYSRIDVEDSNLLAAKCSPNYPFWDKVCEWRVAARYFSAELARSNQLSL